MGSGTQGPLRGPRPQLDHPTDTSFRPPPMSEPAPRPEAWLRGPVPGVPIPLQPVAHALIQALEDVERFTAALDPDALWIEPGGAAAVGFHLRHMAGSLDRLLTYARGEALSEAQKADLAAEKHSDPDHLEELLRKLEAVVESALEQLRETSDEELDAFRPVGRAELPSSVRGLLHHAAEHTARHAGQVSTTVRVVRGLSSSD
jgi:uncharacterized damage-inducible protein DinB